jgi:hypothetical protein
MPFDIGPLFVYNLESDFNTVLHSEANLTERSGKIAKDTEARQERSQTIGANYLSISSREIQASCFSGLWFPPSYIASLAWLRGVADAPCVFDQMISVLLVSRSKA